MMKIDAKRVGRRIRLTRQSHDVSIEQCSKACGVSKTSWSQYELGRRLIKVQAAIAFHDLFGVTLDFVYLGDNGNNNNKRMTAA